MPHILGAAINLNTPGRYLHWSIFTVSEANLVLIAVMVVIFGLALLLPFPGSRGASTVSTEPPGDGHAKEGTHLAGRAQEYEAAEGTSQPAQGEKMWSAW